MKASHSVLLGLILLFLGCGSQDSQPKKTQPTAAMITKANTMTLKKGDQKLHFEYPARVRSMGAVDVYAKASGTLLEQLYKEGDFVQKDTPLFKIDPDKYQAIYNESLAALEAKKAALNGAQREWERAKTLFEQKALSQRERDDALTAYETASAAVANAEATLAKATLDLNYTTILAPIDGMSGTKTHDIGTFIGAQNNAIVTTITQISPIYIEFSVADSQAIQSITAIKAGKFTAHEKLTIKVLDRQGNELDEGVIDFVDSRIDEMTGSIKARAIAPNTTKNLLPGQFVRVFVQGISIPNAATIPQQAVLQTAQGTFIYLLKEGKAKIIPIHIEQALGQDFIITGLFEDGDELIVNNLMKIRPDSPVQAENNGSK